MFRTLATLLSVIAFASCSDPVQPEEEGLTSAEITGLVDLVVMTGLFPSPLPQSDPWSCPAGGTASRSLLFSSPAPGTIVRVGNVTLTACADAIAAGQLTASGAIAVDDRFVLESGVIVEAEGSYAGTVSWGLESRSGVCQFSLGVSAVSGDLRIAGTACDVQVERDV